jgi:hypothetical protein
MMSTMASMHLTELQTDLQNPIRPIPCESAEYVVTVDGKPYAGFVNRAYAEMAVGLWSGELDSNGAPVPAHQRTRPGWPAARGRRLEIIERSYGRGR